MPVLAFAQNAADAIKQGEQVFAKSCATGYCHGVRGTESGAPRLASRGFDQGYIASVVTRGVNDTGMASFASRLSPTELTAVVAYVASLNGIANPNVRSGALPSGPALSGDAAKGAGLFREATRSFGRCSTCHEAGGLGVPVAKLSKVPASVAALKALATPNIKTASVGGEAMPALVIARTKQTTVFYDLTSAPPVERTAESTAVTVTEGSSWRHASAIAGYTDADLGAILGYLRAVVKP